jgi:hypothetical protein
MNSCAIVANRTPGLEHLRHDFNTHGQDAHATKKEAEIAQVNPMHPVADLFADVASPGHGLRWLAGQLLELAAEQFVLVPATVEAARSNSIA